MVYLLFRKDILILVLIKTNKKQSNLFSLNYFNLSNVNLLFFMKIILINLIFFRHGRKAKLIKNKY